MEQIKTHLDQENSRELSKEKVLTYFDFLDQEDIIDNLLNNFHSFSLEKQEEKIRYYFKIDLKTNPDIKTLFKKEVELYKKRSQELNERKNEYIKSIIEWGKNNNIFFRQSINNVKVVATSRPINGFLKLNDVKIYADSFFDHNTNTIYIETTHSQETLVHEYIHAASLINNQKVGFADFNANTVNSWINEGCTLMIEKEIIGNFNHRSTNGLDLYIDGFYWLTTEFIKKLEIDKLVLYKAYFGDEDSMKQLQMACDKKFNCSINDLSNLLFNFSPEGKIKILKILNGEKIQLKETKNIIELAKIFNNIEIIKKSEN